MIDNDGFCQQIRGLEDAMYALAYSILRNDQDAADAISESILKAYCALPQLKNRNAFKSWMLKIVNNTSVEMLRKKPPTAQVGEDLTSQQRTIDWTAPPKWCFGRRWIIWRSPTARW